MDGLRYTPHCKMGFPEDQLKEMFGLGYSHFMEWMGAQTMSVCDGQKYDYEEEKYLPSGCGPHGPVVYPHDVLRYIAHAPIID